MWENVYLSIKKPKSFQGSHDSASLRWQLSASEPGPPLTKSWILEIIEKAAGYFLGFRPWPERWDVKNSDLLAKDQKDIRDETVYFY